MEESFFHAFTSYVSLFLSAGLEGMWRLRDSTCPRRAAYSDYHDHRGGGDDDDGSWSSWDEVQKFATNCRNLAPQTDSSTFGERNSEDIPREEATERFIAKHNTEPVRGRGQMLQMMAAKDLKFMDYCVSQDLKRSNINSRDPDVSVIKAAARALASNVNYDADEPSFEAFLPKKEPECREQFDDADEEPSFITVACPPNDQGSRDIDEAYGHVTEAGDSGQKCSPGYRMDTVSESSRQSPAKSPIKEVRFDLLENHTATDPEDSCQKSSPGNHVKDTSSQSPENPLKSILKVSDVERESMDGFVPEDGDSSESEYPCTRYNERLAMFHLLQNQTTADPADSSQEDQEDQELLASGLSFLVHLNSRKFPPEYYYTAGTASRSSNKPLAASSMPESPVTVCMADSSQKCTPGNNTADTSSQPFDVTSTADSTVPESIAGIADSSQGSNINCVTAFKLWLESSNQLPLARRSDLDRKKVLSGEDVPKVCQEPESAESSSDDQIDSVPATYNASSARPRKYNRIVRTLKPRKMPPKKTTFGSYLARMNSGSPDKMTADSSIPELTGVIEDCSQKYSTAKYIASIEEKLSHSNNQEAIPSASDIVGKESVEEEVSNAFKDQDSAKSSVTMQKRKLMHATHPVFDISQLRIRGSEELQLIANILALPKAVDTQIAPNLSAKLQLAFDSSNQPQPASDVLEQRPGTPDLCGEPQHAPDSSNQPQPGSDVLEQRPGTPDLCGEPQHAPTSSNQPQPASDILEQRPVAPDLCGEPQHAADSSSQPQPASDVLEQRPGTPDLCGEPQHAPDSSNQPQPASDVLEQRPGTPDLCGEPQHAPDSSNQPQLNPDVCGNPLLAPHIPDPNQQNADTLLDFLLSLSFPRSEDKHALYRILDLVMAWRKQKINYLQLKERLTQMFSESFPDLLEGFVHFTEVFESLQPCSGSNTSPVKPRNRQKSRNVVVLNFMNRSEKESSNGKAFSNN